MRICLFEDRHTDDLYPLTPTRATFELPCGLTTLGEKQHRYFGNGGLGYVVRPGLTELLRQRHPDAPVNDPMWLRAGPLAVVNARWLPPGNQEYQRAAHPAGSYLATCRGECAYAMIHPDLLPGVTPETLENALDDWFTQLPQVEVGGAMIRYPWDLITHNAEAIRADFLALCDPTEVGFHPAAFSLVGPADRLYIDPSATVESHVLADTTGGPVVIGPGAKIHAFTRLEGPCHIGPHAQIFGAKIRAGTSIGPHCRVGGEVEASIMLGYSNKYHEGFLGHSVVGEWVNIAAGTHTADLQCDYSPITVRLHGHRIGTGQTKIGTFFGDHARTGIGTLLNCGTVIGPFGVVLPTGQLAPRDIPMFARVGPQGIAPQADLEAILGTARTMMLRRNVALTQPLESVYRRLTAPTPRLRRAG